ncbi:MAG: hypothetical protein V4496_06495, partial [Pseudomonadota bacterium]
HFYLRFFSGYEARTNIFVVPLEERLPVLEQLKDYIENTFSAERPPQFYIEGVERYLQDEQLNVLDKKIKAMLSICAWMAALGFNAYYNKTQIDFINKKINNLFDEENDPSFKSMQVVWQKYLEINSIVNKAANESADAAVENIENMEVLQRNCEQSEDVVLKGLWLLGALQFYDLIKEGLKSKKRVSLANSNSVSVEKQESQEILASKQRHGISVGIFVIILSNRNLSDLKRKEVQQYTQDAFKNEKIRELVLDNILYKIEELEAAGKFFEINDSIESQIPGFVFSSTDCEIFAEQNFSTLTDPSKIYPKSDNYYLSIESFFEKLRAGLSCVAVLAKDLRHHVFLPCLISRLFTAFGAAYQYLEPSAVRAQFLTMECCQRFFHEIKYLPNFELKNKCISFVETWKKIQEQAFRPSIYDLVLAYNAYLELVEVSGFRVQSAIDLIASQWLKITSYKITSGEAKALYFILKSQDQHTYEKEKFDKKRENLARFFTQGVKDVRRLGNVLCVHVLSVSSLFASKIENVRVGQNSKLKNGNRHWRASESLDQITIDCAKICSIHIGVKDNSENYPVVFIYQDAKKSIRCIEVYEESGEIVRNDCLANESFWLSLAARKLPIAEQIVSSRELVKIINSNTSTNDNVLVKARIFPDFFNLILELMQDSMQFVGRLGVPLAPIFVVNYGPKALLRYGSEDENNLIGIFILSLIYYEIKQQEDCAPGVSAWWLIKLSDFFTDFKNGRNNVKNLAKEGIVHSGLFNVCNDLLGKGSPIETVVQALDDGLKPLQKSQQDRQSAYCDWFKKQKQTPDMFAKATPKSIAL